MKSESEIFSKNNFFTWFCNIYVLFLLLVFWLKKCVLCLIITNQLKLFIYLINFLLDLLAAFVLAVLYNIHPASAAPSGLLDRLNQNLNTRVNDVFHQTPEQPTATDASAESVESLLDTDAEEYEDDEHDLRASNAVRNKRNVVTSSTEAHDDSYIAVCSPCHGDSKYLLPYFKSVARIDRKINKPNKQVDRSI